MVSLLLVTSAATTGAMVAGASKASWGGRGGFGEVWKKFYTPEKLNKMRGLGAF